MRVKCIAHCNNKSLLYREVVHVVVNSVSLNDDVLVLTGIYFISEVNMRKYWPEKSHMDRGGDNLLPSHKQVIYMYAEIVLLDSY